MKIDVQTIYQTTIKFAAEKHAEKNQLIPGTNLPYVVHLSNVAMEILTSCENNADFNLGFAIRLALLHDTIEDTSTTYEEILNTFGKEVAEGVLALTKNNALAKSVKMSDSLNRIKELSKEVWAVKLADRITNMQEPPVTWDN
jgi:guanosine-3',5'-bis(diphosphate) 3'-pyrophosphohydrolase